MWWIAAGLSWQAEHAAAIGVTMSNKQRLFTVLGGRWRSELVGVP